MQAPLTTQPRHHHPTQWTTAVSPYSAPHIPPTHTPIQPQASTTRWTHSKSSSISSNSVNNPPPHTHTHTHTIHCANQHPASTTHIWLTPIPTHPVTQPSLTSKSIYNHPTHCKPSPSEHIPSHHHYHPILSTPITAPILHPHRPLHTHTRSTDLTNTQPAPHTHSDSPPFPNHPVTQSPPTTIKI